MTKISRFAEAVMRETERVKLHKETRLDYMTYLMEINNERRKAYKEGKAIGEARGEAREIKLNS